MIADLFACSYVTIKEIKSYSYVALIKNSVDLHLLLRKEHPERTNEKSYTHQDPGYLKRKLKDSMCICYISFPGKMCKKSIDHHYHWDMVLEDVGKG